MVSFLGKEEDARNSERIFLEDRNVTSNESYDQEKESDFSDLKKKEFLNENRARAL